MNRSLLINENVAMDFILTIFPNLKNDEVLLYKLISSTLQGDFEVRRIA